jgi:hypothetical protein
LLLEAVQQHLHHALGDAPIGIAIHDVVQIGVEAAAGAGLDTDLSLQLQDE